MHQHGDEAKVLAGGQSLVPLLNLRLAQPRLLVDINRVSSLDYIGPGPDGGLRIGALTRQRALERYPQVAHWQPLLAEALPLIGDFQIRNRGTVGGSIAHGDPAAELPAVLLTLNGELVIRSKASQRVAAAGDFFLAPLTTALSAGELLCEIRLPPWRPGDGWSICEVAPRRGESTVAGAATRVSLDGSGVCTDARICLFGVAPTPILSQAAAHSLTGLSVTDGAIAEAARLAVEPLEPPSDMHASGEYRRRAAMVLIRRALVRAWRRAAKDS